MGVLLFSSKTDEGVGPCCGLRLMQYEVKRGYVVEANDTTVLQGWGEVRDGKRSLGTLTAENW